MDFLRLILLGAIVYFLFGFIMAVISLIGLVFFSAMFFGHYDRMSAEYRAEVDRRHAEHEKMYQDFLKTSASS